MKARKRWFGLGFLLLICVVGIAQQQQDQKKQDDIPDAPTVSNQPAPANPLPPPTSHVPLPSASESTSQPPPDENTPPPSSSSVVPKEDPNNPFPESETDVPKTDADKPPINIQTVPQGGATDENGSALQDFTVVSNVNQVIIPVRVVDDKGVMINGLTPKDFAVYENGARQKMNFFTSDPFALSVAVIVDLGMPDSALQKVNQTFTALQGSFTSYDEVAVYTYTSAVGEVSDFNAAGRKLAAVLDDLKTVRGHNDGVPVMGGPFGPQGPSINGAPADPSAPLTRTPPKESHVLNDAILKAAFDLSKRDKARRKIIFVISEGREYRSKASYRDVLRVLLTNNIMVYGIGTAETALPGYSKVAKLHVPLMGYSDILPKYASATGGEVTNEYSRMAIDDAYAKIMHDARTQYTLGYVTHPAAGGPNSYREVEVRVDRPDCSQYAAPCIKTFAKAGYYPLPPSQSAR
ncbi:MAG TPA: VWA domain-containing protein [Terriglobales bacterium]